MIKKIHTIFLGILAIMGFLIFVFVLYFNRTPERIIPEGNHVVSPANGEVIHIESVDSTAVHFFKHDIENVLDIQKITPPFTIVVIEMDLKDIHAQRAPTTGDIVYEEHFPGAHKNALTSPNIEKLANVNEKNLIVFQNDELAVGVSQVAGLAARRVQSFVDVGDSVTQGDIYGRIILGSQVVVILPETVTLDVAVGDILVDGETVVGRY